MGITRENIPAEPYLPVAGPQGGGVAVVVKGSPTHANDRHPGRCRPVAAARLAGMGRSLRAGPGQRAWDFRDTAEIVAGLDLVISVDTAIVHLAGAMGKPVWVLLPSVETDWRWGRSGRRR